MKAAGIALAVAAIVLAAPSLARAAPAPSHWCGSDEAATDRLPDAVASYQLHVVYAIPSDGTDRLSTLALPIARDLASVDTWWRGQDPTRTIRWDLGSFAGCDSLFGGIDISFLRLPQPGAAYASVDAAAYAALRSDVLGAFSNIYKKYAVYYDGPIDQSQGVCGVSSFGPVDRGASVAFAFLNGDLQGRCGTVGNADYMAEVIAHEIIHNLGAVAPNAPHQCSGGHVCDATQDIMRPYGTSNSLFDYVLDVGRDDYYGHSGAWWDVQDSAWLSHLDGPQFPLTVSTTGNVKATVSSDLPGLSCPPSCSLQWDRGTVVTLTAQTQEERARFKGWSGACTGEDACSVTVDAAKTVAADFVRQWNVTVSVSSKGGTGQVKSPGTIDCPAGACESLFDAGTRVVLRAVPAPRSRLVGWSLRSCGTGLTCSLTADADKSVAVVFGAGFFRLTAHVSGKGRVSSTPRGLSCSTTCSASFAYGKPVRLSAAPAKGWRFTGWSGDCHGSSACVVKVARASAVLATFRRA